jgi:hypothetical protein
LYIDPTVDADLIVKLRELATDVANEADSIVHGLGTQNVESLNAARTADCNKRINYPKSWTARCLLVYLRYHTGWMYFDVVARKLGAPLSSDQYEHLKKHTEQREKHLRNKAAPAQKRRKAEMKKVGFGRSQQQKQWAKDNNLWNYIGGTDGSGWAAIMTGHTAAVQLGSGFVEEKERKSHKRKELSSPSKEAQHTGDDIDELGPVQPGMWRCPLCKGRAMKQGSKQGHERSTKHMALVPKVNHYSAASMNLLSAVQLGDLTQALLQLAREQTPYDEEEELTLDPTVVLTAPETNSDTLSVTRTLNMDEV